jgi:hypothetical protein
MNRAPRHASREPSERPTRSFDVEETRAVARRARAREALRKRTGHAGDPDRLFAAPIINHYFVNWCQEILPFDTATRLALVESVRSDKAASYDHEAAAHLVLCAVTTVEAWECVERARKASRE